LKNINIKIKIEKYKYKNILHKIILHKFIIMDHNTNSVAKDLLKTLIIAPMFTTTSIMGASHIYAYIANKPEFAFKTFTNIKALHIFGGSLLLTSGFDVIQNYFKNKS
jgi:hypothetical protein